MREMFLTLRYRAFVAALFLPVAASSALRAADSFTLSPSGRDTLLISSSTGTTLGEISVGAIAQTVSLGGASFEVSFVRDADNLLTATLTPDRSGELHFAALKKTIDTSANAVVTLTFSSDLQSVAVDPGYLGSVLVDAKKLTPHRLADDAPAVPQVATTPVAVAAPVALPTAPTDASSPVAAPDTTAAASNRLSFPIAPATLASALTSPLDSTEVSSISSSSTPSVLVADANSPTTAPVVQRLYWSEPVTPPNGPAPTVARSEIKLVELQGSVSVTTADGKVVTGSEGMIVPSGSEVETMDKSSVALFMGGVDSARLMPHCQLTVTQTIVGGVRNVAIDLVHGAVFNRIGKIAGESEHYEVRTPEGVEVAREPDMLTYRGTYQDLRPGKTASIGRWDRSHLVAWNPSPLGHGLISDMTDSILGGPMTYPSTFVYYPGAYINLPYNAAHIDSIVLAGNGLSLANVSITPQANAVNVLQAILVDLQPYNKKLQDLLYRVNSGTGTAGDTAFYNNLITVFYTQQKPTNIAQYQNQPNGQSQINSADSAALLQDMTPFGTNALTPF